MKKKLRVYIYFIFCLVLAFPFSGRADETLDIANGDVTITQAGTYRIENYTGTNKVVVNAKGEVVNITISELNIDVSGTEYACAFDIQAGTVSLTLEGKNVLKSGNYKAGLQVPEGSTLTINGDGELNATGRDNGAGIGGGSGSNGGTITIIGGTVTATGGRLGAGIGGGNSGNGGTIKITGGTVTATGEIYGAGIGGGYSGNGGTITITGGTVNATGKIDGAGIGGGDSGSGGTIIITGGTVTATREGKGAGIGGGNSGQSGTFSAEGGNAFIIVSSISDKSGKESSWQGVIFEGNEGHIYGNPVITTNVEIPEGKKLIINDGQELVFAAGVTFTNNGTIEGSDKIKLTVTYHKNYDTDESINVEALYNSAPSYADFIREYYSIEGWYDNASGGQKVEKITGSIDLYAHWIKNEIKTIEPLPTLEGACGKEIEYDLSQLLSEDSYKDNIVYKSSDLEAYGLSISADNKIVGIPKKVTVEGSTITITISNPNCEEKVEAKVPINIAKGKSSIDNFDNVSDIFYNGKAVNITSPNVKNESGNKIDGATAELSYQIKTGDDQYEQTSADNSGAEGDGEAPKYAGEYKVIASFVENDNYAAAVNQTAEFIIKKAALTVTPLPDQIVLPNETKDFKPKYEVTGAVNNEKPLFNGDLKLNNDGKTIVNNDLTLKDPFDKNYSMTITESVTVTILDNAAANDIITLSGKTEDDAYIDEVTITAPEGFLIKLVSGTKTKAVDGYDKSFPWNKIGTFEISYKLKRKDGGQESDTYKITVTVKENDEEPVDPDTPDNPPVEPEEPIEPPTNYTVTLPSVVGATTYPAAGDHEVEKGSSFRFRLTLDKDYNLSKPVVTTDYGAVIASQGEDGVYVINQVSRSFEIRIDGVVKNPDPVANTEIQSGIKVWGNNHRLFIRTDRPEEVAVYTFSGQLQKKFRSEVGDRFISLPSGTYIVLIGDKRFKVIL